MPIWWLMLPYKGKRNTQVLHREMELPNIKIKKEIAAFGCGYFYVRYVYKAVLQLL